MLQNRLEHSNNPKLQTSSLFGLMLIIAGVLFIVDLQLKTRWLTISIPAVLGLILLIYGFLSGKKGWLIAGALVTGFLSDHSMVGIAHGWNFWRNCLFITF